jgi:hypothetical protein
MALFQTPDGEGIRIEPRPRRVRRENAPPRVWRRRRNLEWHRLRHVLGLTVFEIAGIYGCSEPTVRAGLRAAAAAVATKAAEDRAEDLAG